MANSLRHGIALVVALLVSMTPPVARADAQTDAKKEARKHFDRAMELVDDGQIAEAVIEFKRSYELRPHYTVLYNLGQAYIELAKPVEALDVLQRYLKEGGRNIKPERRAEVERDIARQEIRIATLTIKVSPDGAAVRVDGVEIGKAPLPAPVSVGIGEHVVSATADGREPAETKVTVAGEDRKAIELALQPLPEQKAEVPAPAPASAPATAPISAAPTPLPVAATPSAEATAPWMGGAVVQPASSSTEPSTGRSGLRVGGAITTGVGLAAFVTAIVCWKTAQSRHDSAVTYWNRGGDADNQANELQSQAKDYATATTVSLVAGSILTAAGVGMYLWGLTGGQDGSAPSSTPQTRVLPLVGPGYAGVTTRGAW